MAGEWVETTLGHYTELLSGGTPFKGNTAFWTGTIPWVSAKDMKLFRLQDTEDHISESAVGQGGRVVPAGTVLMLVRGMTLHHDVPICITARKMAFNQDIKALRPSPGVDSGFLAYWLLAKKPDLLASVDHAGHGTGRLVTDSLKKLPLKLPPLPEQKAIASILGALDDKIELNRRMNATLESMARALFQSWFVDFDPVRAKLDGRQPAGLDPATAALFPASFQDSPIGPIPAGWEVGSILKQADLLSGGTPKTDNPAFWNGPIPWASAKDVSQCGESFLLKTGRTITELGVQQSATRVIPAFSTAIVARGATTGRMTMFALDMAMNQTCYGLKSRLNAPFSLYCQAIDFMNSMVHAAHGSVFDTITTRTLETTPVLLPPSALLRSMNSHLAPYFSQLKKNLEESRTLSALRDELLAPLISGKLGLEVK